MQPVPGTIRGLLVLGGGALVVVGARSAWRRREKAPSAASRDMYLDKNGNVIPNKSTLGAMAVGVPGTIAGLFEVHKKFGTIPIEELIQPAIDLATHGVVVTKHQARMFSAYRHLFEKANKRTIFLDKDSKFFSKK